MEGEISSLSEHTTCVPPSDFHSVTITIRRHLDMPQEHIHIKTLAHTGTENIFYLW